MMAHFLRRWYSIYYYTTILYYRRILYKVCDFDTEDNMSHLLVTVNLFNHERNLSPKLNRGYLQNVIVAAGQKLLEYTTNLHHIGPNVPAAYYTFLLSTTQTHTHNELYTFFWFSFA